MILTKKEGNLPVCVDQFHFQCQRQTKALKNRSNRVLQKLHLEKEQLDQRQFLLIAVLLLL